MKLHKYVVAAAFTIFAHTILFASTSSAQAPEPAQPSSESALAVSPAIMEQVLVPGESKTTEISVTNVTNVPLPISSTVRNFIPNEEIDDTADRTIFDASQWFSVSEPQFILQPKTTKTVTVTITPPPKAVPGGHYATLYFQPLVPSEALTPNTANLSARVGVLAFLVVSGDIQEKLSLAALKIPSSRQHGPVPIEMKLANQGTVHVSPNGTISVKNWRGKTVEELELPLSIVLPHTIRTYELSWGKRWMFGKYTVSAEVTYGPDQTRIVSDPVSLWVVPWWAVAAVGLPLSSFTLFTIRTRKRWKHAWQILRGHHGAQNQQ